MWDATCRIPWRGKLFSKACALPPPMPLTWFLLMRGLSASASQPSKSGFKPSERVLGSWAANADGGSARLLCEVFASSQFFLVETGNSLPSSPEGNDPVSMLPASGCPLGAVTVISKEENTNQTALLYFLLPNLPFFITKNLQAQPMRFNCGS